ncbi:5-deoxy-glucuronate isomerase [Vibrio marisflavi]|uniref:5-deoxy-glucuronate isomerase n=1 Tax=Vibrio marisflavi CECT 7928 TaxID=634439 RepID=A0ABN8DZE5_9VIBR|nr:5-deoxy-glucuronate isomerase [Vibrio marisflavi]CAH0537098.1 5-deoxy-glucuronate isomerase [Vibrio marisflavi CECT 7928]
MSDLLSKYPKNSSDTVKQSISPSIAGWKYVGFKLLELAAGKSAELPANENELCLVLVSGKATISTKNEVFENIGDRMSPFEKKKPYAVYIAPHENVKVVANTDLELAVCEAPGKNNFPTRLITPTDIDAEHRGQGKNQRFVHNILPDNKPADSLLVVEVYTDEGCSSSYPSHKHDEAIEGTETYLEETYYHRISPPQGFCFQRVYTDDRELDESMAVYDKDVVMVPKGYHPVATLAGYNSYYLNVMAGPNRKWQFTWEQDHSWINTEEYK